MRTLFKCSAGVTSIQYAMIAMLVSILAVAAFQGVATNVDNSYYQLMQYIPR